MTDKAQMQDFINHVEAACQNAWKITGMPDYKWARMLEDAIMECCETARENAGLEPEPEEDFPDAQQWFYNWKGKRTPEEQTEDSLTDSLNDLAEEIATDENTDQWNDFVAEVLDCWATRWADDQ